jgi:hypothetical protein
MITDPAVFVKWKMRWKMDAGSWKLDTGSWILEAGYWKLDAEELSMPRDLVQDQSGSSVSF